MKLYILLFILLIARIGKSQDPHPNVGHVIPDFRLSQVEYYNQNFIVPASLKGKWTILDFWSIGCSACVKSFPKLNELQQAFKENIQIILIGLNNNQNRNIRQVYEKFRKNLGLKLTVAYDSTLFRKFNLISVPSVVIVDPSNTVYAVTHSDFLQRDNIQRLIDNVSSGVSDETFQKDRLWEYWIQDTATIHSLIHRSVLSKYKGELLTKSFSIDKDNAKKGLFQTVHLSLSQLYLAAYNWHPTAIEYKWRSPVLEITDTSAFQFDTYTYDGLYNYSVIAPVVNDEIESIQKQMQRDLKAYFGYDVQIETRLMPYWRLYATRKAENILTSKSSDHYFTGNPIGINSKGIQIENLLNSVREYNYDQPLPFIDETGIKGRIDISFTAVMTDLREVQKALAKFGLILEMSQKEMNVLVIRQPQSATSDY